MTWLRSAVWLALSAILLAALGLHAEPAPVPEAELRVRILPDEGRLVGKAFVRLPAPARLTLHPGRLRMSALRVDGRPRRPPQGETLSIRAQRSLEVEYEGVFREARDNVVRPGSIVLTEGWYPAIDGAVRYRLHARLPKGYTAVSEADRIERVDNGEHVDYRFDFPYPVTDGIGLAASTGYALAETWHGEVLLQTYLQPEFAPAAPIYLARMQAFLDGYEAKFGPYPYRRLALVEAPVSSSLSMPTYVLLEPGALRELPEGLPTLGHELAHEWFGNTVYIAFDAGNWAEGAAIYFAEHELEAARGSGWRCRKRILTAYDNRVQGRGEISLAAFYTRTDDLTRWIGYGKSALVYHMLRQEIGDEAFFAAIRDFLVRHRHRVATWNDLRASAERAGGRNLGWFFRQWVEGTGTPRLRASARARPLGDGRFETTVTLGQTDPPFRLRLPVAIKTADGTETRRVWLDGTRQDFRFETDTPPQAVVIDEDYDVLRALDDSERYPTLGQVANAREVILVLPVGDARPYRPVIERFRAEGKVLQLAFERPEFPRGSQRRAKGARPAGNVALRRQLMQQAGHVSAAELAARSFVVLGRDNPILARLFAHAPTEGAREAGASLEVLAHPSDAAHFVAVIDSADERDSAALLEQTSDAAGYSQVRVEHGQVVDKRTASRTRGWVLPVGSAGIGAGS